MRVFIPIFTSVVQNNILPIFIAHGVTTRLQRVMDESIEELEATALLAAADDSLRMLSDDPSQPPCRLIVAADVEAEDNPSGALETEVRVTSDVTWGDVVALFADEPSIASEINRARAGDDDAFENVAEADLLWYDVSEAEELCAEINRRHAQN